MDGEHDDGEDASREAEHAKDHAFKKDQFGAPKNLSKARDQSMIVRLSVQGEVNLYENMGITSQSMELGCKVIRDNSVLARLVLYHRRSGLVRTTFSIGDEVIVYL